MSSEAAASSLDKTTVKVITKPSPIKLGVPQAGLSPSEDSGEESLLTKNFEHIKSSNREKYNSNQMYLAESYEDLLSTAIINKVNTYIAFLRLSKTFFLL